MSEPDWGAIESAYRAGMSLREISAKFDVSVKAIRYRAKKYGWEVSSDAVKKNKKTGAQNRGTVGAQNESVPQEKYPQKIAKSPSCNPVNAPLEHGVSQSAGIAVTPEEYGLSGPQAKFAQLIVDGKSRVDAYKDSGHECDGKYAYQSASRMYRNVKVQRYIHALRNERQKRYAVELDDLITQLSAIVNADPNALSQYRHLNCRYCWGEGHKYQWRDIEEQLQAEKRAELDKRPPPDVSGGIGFVDNADPNPDCPRCLGEGKGEAYFPDTRDIEGDERYLFQGVKVTMNGVQIVIADKDAARRELARLLVVRGADARQTELNIQRLELQNEKLAAEIAEIRRNTPPPDDDKPGQVSPDISPQDAEIQYSRILK